MTNRTVDILFCAPPIALKIICTLTSAPYQWLCTKHIKWLDWKYGHLFKWCYIFSSQHLLSTWAFVLTANVSCAASTRGRRPPHEAAARLWPPLYRLGLLQQKGRQCQHHAGHARHAGCQVRAESVCAYCTHAQEAGRQVRQGWADVLVKLEQLKQTVYYNEFVHLKCYDVNLQLWYPNV